MRYDAISFDTNTVMGLGFHFERGLLEQLNQFKDNPTQVVVSEVVVREITDRLTASNRTATEELASAERKARELRLIPAKAEASAGGHAPDPAQVARERVASFLERIGAQIVPADLVPMRALLDRYFRPAPPFSPTGKKKNEFPDAIALLSLEAWAESDDRCLLAVTDDKDWEACAAKSARIDTAKDLTHALALLQQHAEEAERIVTHLLTTMDADERAPLAVELFDMLSAEVSSATFNAEAHSIFAAELWALEVELKAFQFIRTGNAFRPIIVRAGKRKIAAQVSMMLTVEAHASFSLSAPDPIDKDMVPMGSAEASTRATLVASALLTFEGNFSGPDEMDQMDEVELTDVSLVEVDRNIDFGEVEPSWRDEIDEPPEIAPAAHLVLSPAIPTTIFRFR